MNAAYEMPSLLSIVQELVINALEAESTNIRIRLAKGGLEMITVSDDGTGILQESLDLIAQQGCTSKEPEVRSARGGSLAAILAVSKQLRICTKTQHDEVATFLVLDSHGRVAEKREAAGSNGTSIDVVQPLANVPVRYRIARTQVSRTIKGAKEWLVSFSLANFKTRISLSACSSACNPGVTSSILAFNGAQSLESAVSCYLGSRYADKLVTIIFPDDSSKCHLPPKAQRKLIGNSIAVEGVFARVPKDDRTVSGRLSRFSLSINGIPCKADALPTLAARLEDMCFVGVMNVNVLPSKLDVSVRTPRLCSPYDAECIEAEVVGRLQAANEEEIKSQISSPKQQGESDLKCKVSSLAQWARGQCDIGSPVEMYRPQARTAARKLAARHAAPVVGLPPNKKARRSHEPTSLALESPPIPKAGWSVSSDDLDATLRSGVAASVLCCFTRDGSMIAPASTATQKVQQSDIHLCLVWASGKIIALDVETLPLDLASSSTIQLRHSMKSSICLAVI
ncbi:hypothetical protein GGI12_002862 [Dipsacomyces acuminosporus]|nr:hypothetical protein GGI12_002862 [Dipsacomyces acuminosporus]